MIENSAEHDDATEAPDEHADDLPTPIDTSLYKEMTGEPIDVTFNIDTWDTGVRALQAFERLEHEVQLAEELSQEARIGIRKEIFPLVWKLHDRVPEAGIYRTSLNELKEAQSNIVFSGLVEACDGNNHVHRTLSMDIVQVAVALVSYNGEEETWAHRVFRRDVSMKSEGNLLDRVMNLLEARSPKKANARAVTERLRRAIMTYMERVVLAEKSQAPWVMGHGNPLAFELLTGSGLAAVIELSIPVLRKLIDRKQFVFVASDTNKQHFITIGDALEPLEYAILDDALQDIDAILAGGYRGTDFIRAKTQHLDPLRNEVAKNVLTGVFRASRFAPAQLFYAHREHVHEAALIAMADSVLQEHRGFPMLIDMADNLCRTYFGAETLNRPTQAAFASQSEPFRYLNERATRP